MKKSILFILVALLSVTYLSAIFVEVGNGTATTNYIPAYGLYDYGWSRTIYLQSDLINEMDINMISYDVSNTPANHVLNNQSFYMKHTAESSISSTDYIDPITGDGYELVYSGDLIYDIDGWYDILLDSEFEYNGTDNLEILVINNDGDWSSDYPQFTASSVNPERAVYKYADSTFPTSSGILSAAIPNTRFHFTVEGEPRYPLIISPANNSSNNELDTGLVWTYGENTEFIHVYLSANEADVINNEETALVVDGDLVATYSPTLENATTYYWKVVASNSTSEYISSTSIYSFSTTYGVATAPYFEDFEDVTPPTLPLGWTAFHESTTNYSYVDTYSYQAYEGINSIRIANQSDASGTYIAVLPQIENMASRMKFYAKCSSIGAQVIVGYFTDIADYTTFTEIQTVDLTSDYMEHTVELEIPRTVRYLGFKHANISTYQTIYLDNVLVEEIPENEPTPATLLTPIDGANQVPMNAELTWAYGMNTVGVNLYLSEDMTEVADLNAAALLVENQDITAYIADLEEWTNYYWRIGSLNSDGYEVYSDIYLFTTQTPEGIIQIGNGRETNQHLPMEPYYGYTISQSIYDQELINVENKRIEQILYYYNGNSAWTEDNIQVYLGHTDLNEFTDATSWVPISDLVLVYDGPLTVPAQEGWVTIPLSLPFNFNNEENLVVAFEANTQGYTQSSDEFFCTASTGNKSIYQYSDSVNSDFINPVSGTPLSYIPNVLLSMGDIPTTPQLAVNPEEYSWESTIINTSANSVTFSMRNAGINTLVVNSVSIDQDVDFILNDPNIYPIDITSDVAQFTVTFNPLAVGEFVANVIINDAEIGDTMIPLTGSGYDVMIYDFPYIEGFETALNGELPQDWNRVINSNTSYASIGAYNGNAYEGEQSLRFYNSSDIDAEIYAITPPISSLVTKNIRFNAKSSDNATELAIGVTNSNNNIENFIEIMSIPLSTEYEEYFVNLYSEEEDVQFIVFKADSFLHTYDNIYIDNIIIEEKPQEPVIAVIQDTLDFGEVYLNRYGIEQISIQNLGLDSLDVQLVSLGSELRFTPSMAYIESGDNQLFTIKLEVATEGDYTGSFEIVSNDPENPSITINTRAFVLPALPENIAIVGRGTSVNLSMPIEPWYGYTYSQVIYHANEINLQGQIDKISWHYNGNSAFGPDDFVIYLGHTDNSQFSDNNDWIDITQLTEVYNDTLTTTAEEGWIEFEFDTPFVYDSSHNLVVAVEENTQGYHNSGDEFFCTLSDETRGIVYYSDGTNPDPLEPPTANYMRNAFANIQLEFGEVYHAPVIQMPESFTFEEDGQLIIDMSEYIYDVDEDSLSISVTNNENIIAEVEGLIVTLTSTRDWYGSERLTFSVNDGFSVNNLRKSRTIDYANTDIVVTPVNDAPNMQLPEFFTFEEDGELIVDIADYAIDPEGNDFNITVILEENVRVNISGTEILFRSTPNWYGTEQLIVRTYDNGGRAISVDTTQVIVTAVNDAPTLTLPRSYTFEEDAEFIIDMSGLIFDIEGDQTLLYAENTENVFIEINDLIVTLTTTQDWYGTESVFFTVSDDENRLGLAKLTQNKQERKERSKNISRASSTSYVNIVVTPVNDAPTIELPAAFIFEEDTSLVIDMSEYLYDIDGDPLLLSVVEQQFIIVDINDFQVTFSAPDDWVGTEEITFIVEDGIEPFDRNISNQKDNYLQNKEQVKSPSSSSRASSSASVSIQVIPENDEPTIELPDFFTFEEDGELMIDMSEYAEDVDGEALTLTVSDNQNVIVEISDLMVTLRGVENWYGTEQLTFSVDDGVVIGAGSRSRVLASDSINVIITSVNDSPTIELPVSFTFEEDEELIFDISEYIEDVDGDEITLEIAECEYITAILTGMEITLGAIRDWYGTEQLTVTINDNIGRAIATANTDIIVSPVNDVPTIDLPESFTFEEDGELIFDLSQYITDIDGDLLALTVRGNENIMIDISDLLITLRATENWYGSESLVFTVDDGVINEESRRVSASDTMEIFVTSVNDAPSISFPEFFTFEEDGELIIDMAEYINDIEEDQLVFSVTGNENIIVIIDSMIVTLQATEDWFGTEVVNFMVDDGVSYLPINIARSRATSSSDVSIVVNPVNDAPTIVLPASFTFEEDGELIVDMSYYTDDVEGDPLTLTALASENIFIQIDALTATLSANLDWNGTEEITFTVNDNNERAVASAQVDIIVTPVNDAPTIDLPASFTFAEDGALLVDISEYTEDIDGDELNLLVSGNENVTAIVSGMEITLGAIADWFGTEEITITVNDNNNRAIASATTDIIVTPVNDAPTIELPASFTFAEDSELNVDMSDYVADIDEDELTLTMSGNENIQAEISGLMVTLSASLDWNGTEEVTFTVNDNNPLALRNLSRASSSASIDIIVTPVNDAPTVELPTSFTFAEDSQLIVDMCGYITDIDNENDELTLSVIGQENVNVSVNCMEITLGTLANWFGTEELIITVNDNNNRVIASATTNIIVTPVNDAPTIELPASFTFAEDGELVVDMSQYLADIEEDELTLTISGNDSIQAEISGLMVTLSASLNWNGTEEVTFTVDDNITRAINGLASSKTKNSNRLTSSSTIDIIVTPVNDAPTIELPASFTFEEDGQLIVDMCGYIADIDNENDELTLSVAGQENVISSVNCMEITLGTLANWFGTEELTITINDSNNRAVASAITNIIVTAVNDAPTIALPASFTFAEDGELTIDMNDYIADVEGDPFTFTITDSENITSEIDGLMITLSATPDWAGTEEITFTADDGITRSLKGRATSSMTTNIIVTPVNDAPTITLPDSFTFAEDGELIVDISDYVEDIDEDELTITISDNENIQAEISEMMITLSATPDWFGTEEITITVNDNNGRAVASAVTDIIVTSVNDAPTITLPNSFTFVEDGDLVIDMSEYIVDVEDDPLTLTVAGLENIIVEIDELIVTLSSPENWHGSEQITFTIDDGITRRRATSSMTTNIIITPVNDAPTIDLPASFTFEEDCQLIVDVSLYIEDLDEDELSFTLSGHENITATLSGTEVTLGALENWFGTEEITITVNDGRGRDVASAEVDIIVTPVNDQPNIISFNPTEIEIEVILNDAMDFSISAVDVDSEINYSWYVNDENQNNDTNQFNYTFIESLTYEVTVVVSDEEFSVEHSWDITVPVANDNNEITPLVTGIMSNYPNPFNPYTNIKFSLEKESLVQITIYDLKGKVVRTLYNGSKNAGVHTIAWNGLNNDNHGVASSVYYVRMTSNEGSYTRKITLMK